MDTNERIDDLIFLTKNLAELLTTENAALERNQVKVVADNVERKVSLARAYEVRVKGMVLAQAQTKAQNDSQTQGQAPAQSDSPEKTLTGVDLLLMGNAVPQSGDKDDAADTNALSAETEEVDKAAIEHLRELGKRVEELVEENARLLKINIETGKRFMESLAGAVQDSGSDAGIYGRAGKLGNDYAQRTQQGSSVTLDQQL